MSLKRKREEPKEKTTKKRRVYGSSNHHKVAIMIADLFRNHRKLVATTPEIVFFLKKEIESGKIRKLCEIKSAKVSASTNSLVTSGFLNKSKVNMKCKKIQENKKAGLKFGPRCRFEYSLNVDNQFLDFIGKYPTQRGIEEEIEPETDIKTEEKKLPFTEERMTKEEIIEKTVGSIDTPPLSNSEIKKETTENSFTKMEEKKPKIEFNREKTDPPVKKKKKKKKKEKKTRL